MVEGVRINSVHFGLQFMLDVLLGGSLESIEGYETRSNAINA